MKQMYKNNIATKFVSALLLSMVIAFASFNTANAQVTGTGDAANGASLQAVIAALPATLTQNTTITLVTGNPQTAPNGGYVISTNTAGFSLIITGAGSGSIVTAGVQTANNVNDAIFKIIGSDNVTITGFQMQENAANTITGVATNTMTEFGIAIYAATTTNGAKNNIISNNTISLSSAYTQSIGILGTSTFASTNGATVTAIAASTTGGENSGNIISGNTISSVAFGISIVSQPATATYSETGWIIGQSTLGNTITYTGNAALTTASYGTQLMSLTVHGGIIIRNAVGSTVSYNTINTAATISAVSTNGIVFSASTAPASGVTFTNTASNNIITMTVNNTTVGNTTNAIDMGYGLTATGTIVSSTNTIIINQNTTVAATGAIVGVKAAYVSLNNTCNSNNVTFNQIHTPTTALINSSAFTGVTAAAAASGDINASSNIVVINQTVNHSAAVLGTLSGAVIGVTAATTAINNTVNSNKVTITQWGNITGTTTSATISSAITGVTNNTASATIGVAYNGNYNKVIIIQKGNNACTGASTITLGGSAITGVAVGGVSATAGAANMLGDSVSLQRNITQTATSTFSVGTGTFIGVQGGVAALNFIMGSSSVAADKNIVQVRDDSALLGTTTYGASLHEYIFTSAASGNQNILGNIANNGSSFAATTGSYDRSSGTVYGIYHSSSPTVSAAISNNSVYIDRSRLANTATTYGMYDFGSSSITSYTQNANNVTLLVNSSTSGITMVSTVLMVVRQQKY